VLYGVGARLDAQPDLLFTLRRVDAKDLVTQAGAGLPQGRQPSAAKVLDDAALADVFGIEMDVVSPPAKPAKPRRKTTGKQVEKVEKVEPKPPMPKKTVRKKVTKPAAVPPPAAVEKTAAAKKPAAAPAVASPPAKRRRASVQK
jgi:uncharacterized Zn finger protein